MKKIFVSMLFVSFLLNLTAQNVFNVTVNQPPTLVVDAGTDITTCYYDSVQIGAPNTIVGGTPPFTITWFPPYGLSNPFIANPMALPDDTTVYTITVTDANGCSSFSQIKINIDPCAYIADTYNNFVCQVFPNPSKDGVFNLQIESRLIETILNVNVFSIYGQILYSDVLDIYEKTVLNQLELSNLPKGIYILELGNEHKKIFKKIMIQ